MQVAKDKRRTPPAASSDADGHSLENESEPRPETFVDWLALWPIVTVAWLVAVPLVLLYVAVGFITQVLSWTRLRHSKDSKGTGCSARLGFEDPQAAHRDEKPNELGLSI